MSLETVTKVKPSASRFAAFSPSRTWMPQAMPLRRAASLMRTSAASSASAAAGSPKKRAPSAADRSAGPTYTASRPSVAQMASRSSSAAAVSIITMQATCSSISAGTEPSRTSARTGPPRLRVPTGWCRQARTTVLVCSALSTMGTITARAPVSRATPIATGSGDGTRITPADRPRASTASIADCQPGWCSTPCWPSTPM